MHEGEILLMREQTRRIVYYGKESEVVCVLVFMAAIGDKESSTHYLPEYSLRY